MENPNISFNGSHKFEEYEEPQPSVRSIKNTRIIKNNEVKFNNVISTQDI